MRAETTPARRRLPDFLRPTQAATGLPLVAARPETEPTHPTLLRLIDGGHLHAVFQPIFDFRSHRYHGFEGLIRGPAGSAFESPAALLSLVQTPADSRIFDLACIETIISAFCERDLPGTLFINVSPNTLLNHEVRRLDAPRWLRSKKLDPARVVLELIENQKIDDFDALRDAIADYRGNGLRVAIDDLGEGFSNLRLWSEVRPDYVKIDKHFVQGIGADPLKFHLVNAMHELAEQTGASIIAEGIENELDFLTIRDLRIHCAQGYFVARPAAAPSPTASQPLNLALQKRQLFTPRGQPLGLRRTVDSLCRPTLTLAPEATTARALDEFEADDSLLVIPVVDHSNAPCGLLNRHDVISRFARPYRRELYGKRSCTVFMDSQPVIVDRSLTVQEVGRMLSRAEVRHMASGFIVTDNGRFAGVGRTQDLMATITEMQLTAARYANPLTHLPGNVPINEQIDRLIAQGHHFTVCYGDIDHFKPFNDQFGYACGDDVIEMTGRSASEVSDSRLDFVGHVGGDDFILVFQSEDWEARCHRLLRLFDERMRGFLPRESADAGGYLGRDRRHRRQFIPVPTLSIGALPVAPGQFEAHGEIAATVSQIKRLAKAMHGSSLFVERRSLSAPPRTDA